jgi:hypothetical protein
MGRRIENQKCLTAHRAVATTCLAKRLRENVGEWRYGSMK